LILDNATNPVFCACTTCMLKIRPPKSALIVTKVAFLCF